MPPSMQMREDERRMRAAFMLARHSEGRTRPNPAVGCVIVRDGGIIGCGRTADGGRPHAETIALEEAGGGSERKRARAAINKGGSERKRARAAINGATVYITLEPCAHHGETPPCADALIAAGIKRAVIAMHDPDKKVAGQGAAMLEAAGIETTCGVLADTAREFYRAYIKHRRSGMPFVTVKLATSLDGRIALADGASKWITSPAARRLVHEMRSRHDAVMTSASTYRMDNPRLTHRLAGYRAPQPLRVVVSSRQVIDAASNLAKGAGDVLHLHSGDVKTVKGMENMKIPADDGGKPCLTSALTELGRRGVTSVLVEAGGNFCAALLAANLIDRLIWMRSAGVIGNDGTAGIAALGLHALEDGRMFNRTALYEIGGDTMEVLERKNG